MKKRLISLLLISAMVLAVGCGSKEKEEDKAPADDTVQDDTNADETTGDDTTGDDVATDDTVTDDTTGDDTTVEDTIPGMPAMDDTLTAIFNDVTAHFGDDYLAKMALDVESIEALKGISSDLYDYAFVNVPMMSAHVDSFWGFKAAEGKVEDLKAIVVAAQDALKNDFMQYPSNIPKIHASQVLVYGDYVFFVMLGVIDDVEKDEAELLEDYTAELQPALDIIAGYFE